MDCTKEFLTLMSSINNYAKGCGFYNGLAMVGKAYKRKLLSYSDFNDYKNIHNVRNAIAHGNAVDVSISEVTLNKVKRIFDVLISLNLSCCKTIKNNKNEMQVSTGSSLAQHDKLIKYDKQTGAVRKNLKNKKNPFSIFRIYFEPERGLIPNRTVWLYNRNVRITLDRFGKTESFTKFNLSFKSFDSEYDCIHYSILSGKAEFIGYTRLDCDPGTYLIREGCVSETLDQEKQITVIFNNNDNDVVTICVDIIGIGRRTFYISLKNFSAYEDLISIRTPNIVWIRGGGTCFRLISCQETQSGTEISFSLISNYYKTMELSIHAGDKTICNSKNGPRSVFIPNDKNSVYKNTFSNFFNKEEIAVVNLGKVQYDEVCFSFNQSISYIAYNFTVSLKTCSILD